MKKTIVSIAIASTLFAGTVGMSSVLAATLDDSSDKVVPTQNVSIQSEQPLVAALATQKDSTKNSNSFVKNLLAAQDLAEKETPTMTTVTKVEKIPTVATYTVVVGDTIENIAKAFEVSVDDLIKWNQGMTADAVIQIGQGIKIQTEKDPATVETTKLSWEAPVVEAAPAPVAETQDTTLPATEAPVETAAPATPVVEVAATATSGRSVTVTASAYSYSQAGLSAFTATGIDLRQTPNVIAVDPSVIPLGSRVMVEGYGEAIAGDTGGAIVGNRIDIHFSTVAECYQWGVRTVQVTILN